MVGSFLHEKKHNIAAMLIQRWRRNLVRVIVGEYLAVHPKDDVHEAAELSFPASEIKLRCWTL